MSAIWRKIEDRWTTLPPSGFPNEEALHDLIEEAPQLLPLSGDPTLAMVGREVPLMTGRADLVAVESDGRLVIIEIKLNKNGEARRAVVAQVLTYAAYLKGTEPAILEEQLLRADRSGEFTSLVDAASRADESGSFDEHGFRNGLADSLTTGSFRLVLVLDEAPSELVQLVGYLESISPGVVLDLVTVSSYDVGDEQVLVPQRVEPAHAPELTLTSRRDGTPARRASKPTPIEGTEPFEQSIERASAADQPMLRALLAWARELEARGLATLKSVIGEGRDLLLVWIPGEKGGLVSVWNDSGAYLSLWRSVFARRAWTSIAPIEAVVGDTLGNGKSVRAPSDELLALLTTAYETAEATATDWDGHTYYVSFGEGPERSWEDAREYGFVAAGGGAWYSKTLRQLGEGARVLAYIPKGNGAGGYVGIGVVIGPPTMAKDFMVEHDGERRPLTEVARAPDMARDGTDDPDIAEWVVPVDWEKTVPAEQAIKDSDFFANQNTAVKLTHGYTLSRVPEAFGQTGPRRD